MASQFLFLFSLIFTCFCDFSFAITATAKDLTDCTMCSSCDNPYQPIYSSPPPPPSPVPSPPPPSPSPPTGPNCPPPPSPPSSDGGRDVYTTSHHLVLYSNPTTHHLPAAAAHSNESHSFRFKSYPLISSLVIISVTFILI